jgi:hypothetical protein
MIGAATSGLSGRVTYRAVLVRGGRGSFLRVDDADDVRLARRDVHLAQRIAGEEERERGPPVGANGISARKRLKAGV